MTMMMCALQKGLSDVPHVGRYLNLMTQWMMKIKPGENMTRMALWRLKNEFGKLLAEGQISIDANSRMQPLFCELDTLLCGDATPPQNTGCAGNEIRLIAESIVSCIKAEKYDNAKVLAESIIAAAQSVSPAQATGAMVPKMPTLEEFFDVARQAAVYELNYRECSIIKALHEFICQKRQRFGRIVDERERDKPPLPVSPVKAGPGEQMWICPAAEGCTLSLKVSCHHKNPHTHKPHLCDVRYYNCPLCIPVPAPAEPAPVDVGEGWERVPVGTVITEDMEYRDMGGTWHPTFRVGKIHYDKESFYRRRVTPQPPEWAQRVIAICNRLWPKAERPAIWDSRKCEIVIESGKTSAWFEMEPIRPKPGYNAVYAAVSAEYWRERDAGKGEGK